MGLRQLANGLAYLLLVVALEAISSVGLYRHVGITPWNPAAGLSVAVAYLGGVSYAPFVLLSHPVTHLLGVSPPNDPMSFLTAFALGAVYLGTGLILRHWTNFDPSLSSVNDCLRLIIAAIAAAALDTLCHVGGTLLTGIVPSGQLMSVAWRNYIGILVGILAVTPLVLLATTPRNWPAPSWEQLAQLVTIIGTTLIIFGFPAATAYQLFYLLFLPVLWVALRHGVVGAVIVLNVCQIVVILAAHFRLGFLPGLAPLQTMLIVLVVTGLLVGAIVTERQASAKRVREQNAALNRALRLRSAGETAAAIAHEINQPLTAAGTYAGIIEAALDRGDTALARETVKKVREQCDRAAAVVASMRGLVRHGHLDQRHVDLHGLVAGLTELHNDELRSKGIALLVDIPRDLPRIQLDPTQIQQALHNLLSNASESIADSGRGGTITLTARIDSGNAAVLEVRDDGPGFPPGFADLASTPFMTTKNYGSGLGLAVARSVAEAHGGSLAIAPSIRGATVRIKIPVLAEEQCRTS